MLKKHTFLIVHLFLGIIVHLTLKQELIPFYICPHFYATLHIYCTDDW